MNIDVKQSLTKIWLNRIQKYIKELYTMTKRSLGQQDWFIIHKPINATKNHIFTYIHIAEAFNTKSKTHSWYNLSAL